MSADIKAQVIREGEDLYAQAIDLRYRLFFKQHRLPIKVVVDEHEDHSTHVALCLNNTLVAYGRLTPLGAGDFFISQIVVDIEFQRQGYGAQLLAKLIGIGVSQGARRFILHARTTATELYRKLGFSATGSVYKSSKTGVLHVKMVKYIRTKLNRPDSPSA